MYQPQQYLSNMPANQAFIEPYSQPTQVNSQQPYLSQLRLLESAVGLNYVVQSSVAVASSIGQAIEHIINQPPAPSTFTWI